MKLRVFVIWEPILASDFTAPATPVLGRIPDPRARHYWDKWRILAKRMEKDARQPQPKPNCCWRDGTLWDVAAVYPPGGRWDNRLPPARYFDGPVGKVTEGIEAALR